ncbi:aminotransferase class III-fold pyridoxal phosphate-dependent enzyme [Actinomadura sp. KC216]|uniref:aminotransferase class III-fold pyridoxal phosphate-dependent enzyme n=1 Tax=Actinomadura sp. KC216 TaxID=2530370 RepID=UPI00105234F1|nr:aminotransferase class III-fold pyridoxal phosphate-dependent enzyme [Actinomadura sp. KC216]TDB85815.1 aminotransferase class III-fold pyridoxal phosphate-dependent enzyme [Actinomadura sp. KC216]
MPIRSTAHLAELDRRSILHPNLPGTVDERLVMVSGDGCRLRDADGREYLDATGGLWLAQVGHGRPELGRSPRRCAACWSGSARTGRVRGAA